MDRVILPGVKNVVHVYTEIDFLPDFCEGSKAYVVKLTCVVNHLHLNMIFCLVGAAEGKERSLEVPEALEDSLLHSVGDPDHLQQEWPGEWTGHIGNRKPEN